MRPVVALWALLASVCCVLPADAEEAPPKTPPQDETASAGVGDSLHFHAPTKMCFGGYEDGKIIVSQGRIQDTAVETTAKACRIDGGSDARAPQSPVLTARRFASLV